MKMHGKRGTLADRTFSHGKALTLRVIPVFHHDEFKTTSAKTVRYAVAGRTHEERRHQPVRCGMESRTRKISIPKGF